MQHAKLGNWGHMIRRGAEIVESYDTPVMLRQLFHRLVMDEGLPNRQHKYLSASTAKLRREGEFPQLADMTRTIHRRVSWSNPTEALTYIADYCPGLRRLASAFSEIPPTARVPRDLKGLWRAGR